MTEKKKPQKAGNGRARPARPAGTPTHPTDRDIAERAYQLFLQRGHAHGGDREDWLRAERELLPPRGSG